MTKNPYIKLQVPPGQFIQAIYGRNRNNKWELLFINYNPLKRGLVFPNKKAYRYYKFIFAKSESSIYGTQWGANNFGVGNKKRIEKLK